MIPIIYKYIYTYIYIYVKQFYIYIYVENCIYVYIYIYGWLGNDVGKSHTDTSRLKRERDQHNKKIIIIHTYINIYKYI